MTFWNKFPKKTFVFILILIGVYGAGGYYGLPILARDHLPGLTSKWLGASVTIKDAAFNPLLISFQIMGLEVKENGNDQCLLAAEKVEAQVSLESIVQFAPVISKIHLERPEIDVKRLNDGSYSCFLGMKTSAKASKTTASESLNPTQVGLPEFILKNVTITNGSIDFEDQFIGADHQIENLTFTLPYLSTKVRSKNDKTGFNLSFALNQSNVDINVQGTFLSREPSILAWIKTGDVNLMDYSSYFPNLETITINQLKADTDVELLFIQKDEKPSLSLQGKINIKNLDLASPGQDTMFRFPELGIDISPSDILQPRINIAKAVISYPEFRLIKNPDGRLNLLSLFTQTEPEPSGAEVDPEDKEIVTPGFTFMMDQFEIKEGKLDFKDLTREKPFNKEVSSISVKLENLAWGQPGETSFTAKMNTDAQEQLETSGRFNIDAGSVTGLLNISGLNIQDYLVLFENTAYLDNIQGMLNLEAGISLEKLNEQPTGQIKLVSLSMEPLDIKDKKTNQSIIRLPKIVTTEGNIDLSNKMINTGKVSVSGGDLQIIREKTGTLNLTAAVLPQGNGADLQETRSEAGSEKQAWQWIVPEFSFGKTNVTFKDQTPSEPVDINIRNLEVMAENLIGNSDEKGTLSILADWNENGKINIQGPVSAGVKEAQLNVNLTKIDIPSVQPYFTDQVKVDVTNGDFQSQGTLNLGFQKTNQITAQFTGETSVTDFICLDKASSNEFLTAKSFFIAGLDVSALPLKVSAKNISLTDFYSRVLVDEKGRVNLNAIFSQEKEPKAGKKSMSAINGDESDQKTILPEIQIDSVTLQGGRIRFSDYLTQPNFNAEMKAVAGSVTGLSSEDKSRAKLHLKGVHGQSAPLEITGTINPFIEKKFADIGVSFKDIELTRFNPYAAKYLGYKIEKGKLILDLEYKINGNRLTSENRVRFDNFALGTKVESKDATSLPVSLAISLLKNKKGQINLDLPVTGELDDPDFSFAKVIFKMVGNLIVKVATSPFSILGSMFGGGEELEYLVYMPGEIELSVKSREKLDKLIKILKEKPSVKLEIQGIADADAEMGVLRQKGFDELIKAEKIKQMLASGTAPVKLNDVSISPEEMPVYVYLAYTKADFPKPRNKDGTEKQISAEEKKKLLMTHIPVDKETIRALSIQRAEKIKTSIMNDPKIHKERLYMLEPIEGQKNKTGSRVKFSLR